MSTYQFETSPAHTVNPGTTVRHDGVVFSMVFRDCTSCGLILYHLRSKAEVTIPFTDEYRYGSLYSVKIKGLDPAQWAYRYYRDDYSFEDPYARELVELALPDGTSRIACKLFPVEEDNLPAYGSRNTPKWPDQLIYCVHVKGFTASKTSKVPKRGTFLGLTAKIPHLKNLGVTGVELLPVYELRPESLGKMNDVSLTEDTPADGMPAKMPQSLPLEPQTPGEGQKTNYWNFGEGCYFAPKAAYSAGNQPQREFATMVDEMHKAGLQVYLQLFFSDTVTVQTQLETARFYVTHYGIDGFHLKGNVSALKTIASDPMLSDTAIFYYNFPYEELQKEDIENPTVGKPSIEHLCEYTNDFQRLSRRFVKSDTNVIREFAKAFVTVPVSSGRVHYVTNYDGFTLMDLVSYNWKHNEGNGEDNRDGEDENFSWNCGVEGKCGKKEIRTVRMRQIRNLIALNMLAQGTPVITGGDEIGNSQDGNNNPYCQDNETGWINWKETAVSRQILDFTRRVSQLRKEHSVFRRRTPFRFNDYNVSGYPDISFHGKDAYKPDFSGYSHSFGVLFNENYAEENPADNLIYLAINMHWHNQMLGLPAPPQGKQWVILADTFEDEPFYPVPKRAEDQRHIGVRGRSVMILTTAPAEEKAITPSEKKAGAAAKKAAPVKSAMENAPAELPSVSEKEVNVLTNEREDKEISAQMENHNTASVVNPGIMETEPTGEKPAGTEASGN